MPSPFPGMDPYIESPVVWSDFHNDLASEIRAKLNTTIQPDYVARLIPHTVYEQIEVARPPRSIVPDVGVWHHDPPQGGMAVLERPKITTPVMSRVILEAPLRLASVEIFRVEDMELVTAIEILSPVNKRPNHKAFRAYLNKRRSLFNADVHLIEIDFLRAGTRPPLIIPVPEAPYYVTLSRLENRPDVAVWPIQIQDQLPVIPVPLQLPDPDVPLDLGKAVAAVYERGGYASLINYRKPPPPPDLPEQDSEWLTGWFQEKAVR